MRESGILITGASGEIGHALIELLHARGGEQILTLDLRTVEKPVARLVKRAYTGSILDHNLLDTILAEYKVTTVIHLAALLSTRSEFTPVVAHEVNVDGTLAVLEFARNQAQSHGETVKFFYPSSIAAFGLPDAQTKNAEGALTEDEWNTPTTMYGCNKLSCEHLGRYYSYYYKQLDASVAAGSVDFRSLRFPGLISAFTTPSGGTSDFAPEMLHAAAKGLAYDCFVRPDARIPFMAMPDAVAATLKLIDAPREKLTRQVYNLQAFNPSAGEIREIVLSHFPDAQLGFELDPKRMAIVDSWPAAVDDHAAREDWGFDPEFGLDRVFTDYLIPGITGQK
ncbi:epimerase [bacterium]|nr:MAG: epimerase [bacterium]